MKKINIGITIQLEYVNHSVWTNGILQNAINLTHTLMNSSNDYNVFICNIKNIELIPITNVLEWDIERYKTVHFDDVKNDLDMLFILGSQIRNEDGDMLHNKGCKIIHYNCGSHYIVDMENVLYKNGEGIWPYEDYIDEVWIIPQNEKTNYYYFETLNRKPVRVVPFVWNSYFIDRLQNQLPNGGFYEPSKESKRISCFEPNIDVIKFCMYDILGVERVYRKRPELINHFYITNSIILKEKPKFISIMNKLDIVKDKKATFEARYNTPFFLSKYTDIVIAHQWENPLNYAYLDAVYMRYPLVHNASLCKECGYYYNEFNMEEAEQQLLFALEHHDEHIDEYDEKNRKVLDKFSVNNSRTVEIYDLLIDGMFNKNVELKNKYYNE